MGPFDRYKWSYNPYKWPYKWVTGVITLLIGVISPFITCSGPLCRKLNMDPPEGVLFLYSYSYKHISFMLHFCFRCRIWSSFTATWHFAKYMDPDISSDIQKPETQREDGNSPKKMTWRKNTKRIPENSHVKRQRLVCQASFLRGFCC